MLGKLAELMLFGIAPLVVGGLLMPGAIAAEEVAVTGEVSYRERIALPPNAALTVRLLDVSLADAPETVVAEQTIDPAGQVPINFEIKFDSAVSNPPPPTPCRRASWSTTSSGSSTTSATRSIRRSPNRGR